MSTDYYVVCTSCNRGGMVFKNVEFEASIKELIENKELTQEEKLKEIDKIVKRYCEN